MGGLLPGTVNMPQWLKNKGFEGRKLLLVRPEDPHGKSTDTPVIAVDTVRSGVGDKVLFVDEGNSARLVLDWPDGCVRAVIVGYIDEINLDINPKS